MRSFITCTSCRISRHGASRSSTASSTRFPRAACVVYSAHGISPTVRPNRKDRRLVEVDATCPLVTKVHLEVLRFAKDGYLIIFIGHKNHDEAIGTVGEAPER